MGKSVPKPVPKPEVVKTLTIEDKTVIKLLTDKDKVVNEGREISKKIEDVQKRVDELTEEEMKLTEKVEPKDLITRGDELRDGINKLIAELEEVAQKIKDEKMAAIPEETKKEHLKLNSEREKLEQERNKKALKVQKIKDKLIPKLHKFTKADLDEYEDLLSAELKDGVCVVEIFNHQENWRKLFKEKMAENKL